MTEYARVYGDSLYDLASEEKLTDAILEQMQEVKEIFRENPEYITLLSEPSIKKDERTDLIDKAFGEDVEKYLINFLKILCEKNILREYEGCVEEFTKRYNADHGIIEAVVTSAVALSSDRKKALKEKLEKEHPIAYTGYEPSGKIHLGHAVTIMKLKQLQDLGFKIKILLADYHAFLNGKGTVEEIAETAEYNKRCFQGLGLADDTEYILGSSFQTGSEYTNDVYQLATLTTLKRAKRSMDQVSRHDDNPKVASVVYPLMQTADMSALEVDVALGGMEQRKIQMLARENLPRIGKEAPVCIHTPLIHGLDGDDKMSSSNGNYIAVDDDEKTIKDKIKKSYCPMGETEGNPILEIADHFVFSQQDTLLIERPEKFGGNLELTKEELYSMYGEENLHPMDLKNAITQYLIDFLKPVRDFMESQE